MTLREARPEDAHAIATVHVGTWRVAHRGLVDEAELDGLREEDFAARWARILAAVPPERGHWVAGEPVVAFASAGPARDTDLHGAGELYALYVLPSSWGSGVGAALTEQALAFLRSQGHERACLWVLETNTRARRFYERFSFQPDGHSKAEQGRVTVRYQRAL